MWFCPAGVRHGRKDRCDECDPEYKTGGDHIDQYGSYGVSGGYSGSDRRTESRYYQTGQPGCYLQTGKRSDGCHRTGLQRAGLSAVCGRENTGRACDDRSWPHGIYLPGRNLYDPPGRFAPAGKCSACAGGNPCFAGCGLSDFFRTDPERNGKSTVEWKIYYSEKEPVSGGGWRT